MRPVVRLCQWLFGAVFIFSGLVKCIDPVGTAVKMGDYLRAMSLSVPDEFLQPAAWTACVGELMTGIFIFFGWKRKPVWWISLGVMLVFTGLTLWLALTDAVSDCGCFGDAVKLSNQATFWKNVGLLILLGILGSGLHHMWSPANGKLEIIMPLWALLTGLVLCWAGTFRLPVIDFRPYRPGVNIEQAMGVSADTEWEEIYNVIYEKDGRKVEFSLDSLPDEADGWEFVDQAVHRIPKNRPGSSDAAYHVEEPAIRDFFVLNGAGEDITQDFLRDTLYKFVILSPNTDQMDADDASALQVLYEYAVMENYGFTCMTLRDEERLQRWAARAHPRYPFVYSDATIIETMGRANPTVMLLKNGTILWKKALPDVDLKQLSNAKLSEQSYGKIEIIDRKMRFFVLIILLFAPFILYLLIKTGTFVSTNITKT